MNRHSFMNSAFVIKQHRDVPLRRSILNLQQKLQWECLGQQHPSSKTKKIKSNLENSRKTPKGRLRPLKKQWKDNSQSLNLKSPNDHRCLGPLAGLNTSIITQSHIYNTFHIRQYRDPAWHCSFTFYPSWQQIGLSETLDMESFWDLLEALCWFICWVQATVAVFVLVILYLCVYLCPLEALRQKRESTNAADARENKSTQQASN